MYIPALEQALANDHINHGFSVFGPEWYMEKDHSLLTETFIDSELTDDVFIILVEEYFHVMSHNFPEMNGEPIHLIKKRINDGIDRIKKQYCI